jgi:hypothetical protein
VLQGIDLQAGVTVEHYRVSNHSTTTAGLHLEAALEIPVFGGPIESGLSIRAGVRAIFTPSMTFSELQPDGSSTTTHAEPVASAQALFGVVYYP